MTSTHDIELLAAEDVVSVYRLIEQLCERGSNAQTWREFFVGELCRIFDALMAISYVMHFSLDPSNAGPKTLIFIEAGGNESWQKWMARGDYTLNPVTPFIMERFGTDFTCVHQEWFDQAAWHDSEFFRTIATPANWDHAMYSQVGIIRPGVVDGIGITRRLGGPPFLPKDVAMLRLIHQELARLWRKHDPMDAHTLPPRQREVLEGIRRGESRKTIARNMAVSDHTVHTYEKALFDRAKVTSRAELMAMLSKLVRPVLIP